MDLARHNNESIVDYHKRLVYGKLVDKNLADADYSEIAECLYGKQYSSDNARKMLYGSRMTLEAIDEEGYSPIESDASAGIDAKLQELSNRMRDLEIEKVKYRDERNEFQKLIREEARRESYREQIIKTITDFACEHSLEYDGSSIGDFESDSSLIIPLTDLHTGIEIHNTWNDFDEEILRDRMVEYLNKIIKIQHRHNANDAYVVISEILSGVIHPTIRIQNNQDLIEQFLTAVSLISEFLVELCKYFSKVHVFVAPGNHSRVSPKKEDNLTHENMDNLVVPFLRAKLQNFKNISFYDNDIESSIALFNVRGLSVCAVHGDKDSFSDVAMKLGKFLGGKIDICILGHRHTNAMKTDGDTKVVQSGCLSGVDEYALNKRYRNRPEQAVCVITDEDGLECIYDIKF